MSEIKIDQLKRGVKLTEEQLLDIKNGDKLTETLKEKKYLEDSQIDENEIVEFLNEADTNDDGIVTKEEFEKTELATKNNVKFSDVQKLYNKAVTVAEEEIGITTDKDGNKLVTIANWHTGKAPKDGMEVNNCLSRVAKNYKPANMSMADAMQAIIDLNPEIYNSGRKLVGGSEVLYDGEQLKLPPEWFSETVEVVDDSSTEPANGAEPAEGAEPANGTEPENGTEPAEGAEPVNNNGNTNPVTNNNNSNNTTTNNNNIEINIGEININISDIGDSIDTFNNIVNNMQNQNNTQNVNDILIQIADVFNKIQLILESIINGGTTPVDDVEDPDSPDDVDDVGVLPPVGDLEDENENQNPQLNVNEIINQINLVLAELENSINSNSNNATIENNLNIILNLFVQLLNVFILINSRQGNNDFTTLPWQIQDSEGLELHDLLYRPNDDRRSAFSNLLSIYTYDNPLSYDPYVFKTADSKTENSSVGKGVVDAATLAGQIAINASKNKKKSGGNNTKKV